MDSKHKEEKRLLHQYYRPSSDKNCDDCVEHIARLPTCMHTYTDTITHLHTGLHYDFIATSLCSAISTMLFPFLSPPKLRSMKHKINIFIRDAVCIQRSLGT
jgi:hypothetical protein